MGFEQHTWNITMDVIISRLSLEPVMYHANLLTCDIENATVHCISVCIIRSTRTFSPRNIKHYKPP